MQDISERIGIKIKGSSFGGETYNCYIPKDLPPTPPIDMLRIYPYLDKASIALGRLDGMSMVLPDPHLFLYMYIRKEAVLSSQIEGTQSTLSDLLLFEREEIPGVPVDDVAEVSSYVSAMNYGLERLNSLPLSLRLIREIHEKLMSNVRGSDKQPGEFRRSQNWIGGTRPGNGQFVPPSPDYLMSCLDNFEKFLHSQEVPLPTLVKAAIAHVQFETIHPFLDGNGRLGRLLITFILCNDGLLKQPLLYLSLYLKSHKKTYYTLLQEVRETGNWEDWIIFFLEVVAHTALQATMTAQNILSLFKEDHKKIEQSGKGNAGVLNIYHYLQQNPITTTGKIKDDCDISLPTVLRNLSVLEEIGIAKEITGKDRHKIFVYEKYLAMINQGTEV